MYSESQRAVVLLHSGLHAAVEGTGHFIDAPIRHLDGRFIGPVLEQQLCCNRDVCLGCCRCRQQQLSQQRTHPAPRGLAAVGTPSGAQIGSASTTPHCPQTQIRRLWRPATEQLLRPPHVVLLLRNKPVFIPVLVIQQSLLEEGLSNEIQFGSCSGPSTSLNTLGFGPDEPEIISSR